MKRYHYYLIIPPATFVIYVMEMVIGAFLHIEPNIVTWVGVGILACGWIITLTIPQLLDHCKHEKNNK